MKKSYSDKLKDPRWQKKRLEVFNRDEFKCCMCGDSEDTLHVHHKTYSWNKDPWEYELDNFQTLCAMCHFCIEDMKQVPHFKPLKAFKNYSKIHNVGYLYMSTINEQDGSKMIQVWEKNGNGASHTICIWQETVEKLAEMINENQP